MDKAPEIVPKKLDSPINFKIIALIVGLVITFQLFHTFLIDPDTTDVLLSVVSFVNPLAASIAGFIIAKRYFGTHVFGRAYIALALGFLMIFLAEVAYLVYDLVLEIDPYPSIADVFFFSFYPLAIIHLALNINFFKSKLGLVKKSWVIGIPVVLTALWSITSFQEGSQFDFDFYFGLSFVIVSSITLSLSLLGASIFKDGMLGKAWLILVIGIAALNFGDLWYYYLEIFDGYDLTHPVNLFWFSGYWILVYALIKHKSII